LNDEELDCFSEEDYRKIVKAVFDSAIVDYTKLQHFKNRNKKFLQQSFLDVTAMFFDTDFKFEHLLSLEDSKTNLSFEDLIKYYLKKSTINMEEIHNHVAQHSMDYWWDKNFHDLQVPQTITIAGIVWTVINSPSNVYVDEVNKRIYCSTRKAGSDREFFRICLKLILKSAEIELEDFQIEAFFKLFYLFLKINSPLEQYKR
jgi:hypothetical protein